LSAVEVRASIQLLADTGWRRSGWRAVSEIQGIEANDGSQLFGFEAAPLDGTRFQPGSPSIALLRFWAPELSERSSLADKELRIFEGKRQVATGKILDVVTRDESGP
jgi:hypothetical protein